MIARIYNKVKSLSALLLAALALPLLASCDEHEPISHDIYDYVLCDDHRTMTLEGYKSQLVYTDVETQSQHLTVSEYKALEAEKKVKYTISRDCVHAVGVIFAIEDEKHKAMAVMLPEIRDIAFADSLGMEFGTSGDEKAFDGYVNCVAMRNTINNKTGNGSPLGHAVFDSHTFGQSDFIPSYAEAKLLFMRVDAVNHVIGTLIDLGHDGDLISKEPRNGSCWYWTSTEDSKDMPNRAWLCSMATGGFQQTPKTELHNARVIVELNY